jgi:translation initiation factor IF-3
VNKILANDEIYGHTVVVIGQDGQRAEVVKRLAISQAKEKGLDLIQVAKTEKGIPLCKWGDVGKMKFEASKKAAQKTVKTKEMMFVLKEHQHDIDIKKNKVRTMLEKKCIVKFGVELKGRERAFKEHAKKMLEENVADLRNIAKWDDLKVADREIFVILKPIKEATNVESTEAKPTG